ncbi:26S proteasome non-ATPase regulatory subunit 9 [Battus philenor]|uniref:26S proteasome non-ATPase regulatory subunit 9 n=1 Tax=Battus philenor TaxID=42288 RepID=UPI0035D0FEB4
MVGYNMDGAARDRVLKLMEEKDRIESEIRDQTAILESNNVGMHDSLVDGEGFPRNDIDVYKVRHARHRIICLQNDHKLLMRKIEEGLEEVHSNFRGSNSSQVPTQSPCSAPYANGHGIDHSHENRNETQCFAIIGFVRDGSPADLAGLLENDEVLQFGSVNSNNFSDIMQVHDVVAHSVGQRVSVRVKRGEQVISLTVVPRPWSHPGLLGCQITRYTT